MNSAKISSATDGWTNRMTKSVLVGPLVSWFAEISVESLIKLRYRRSVWVRWEFIVEKLSRPHQYPCPPACDWYCRVYGLAFQDLNSTATTRRNLTYNPLKWTDGLPLKESSTHAATLWFIQCCGDTLTAIVTCSITWLNDQMKASDDRMNEREWTNTI